jgi:hypothetical protein
MMSVLDRERRLSVTTIKKSEELENQSPVYRKCKEPVVIFPPFIGM